MKIPVYISSSLLCLYLLLFVLRSSVLYSCLCSCRLLYLSLFRVRRSLGRSLFLSLCRVFLRLFALYVCRHYPSSVFSSSPCLLLLTRLQANQSGFNFWVRNVVSCLSLSCLGLRNVGHEDMLSRSLKGTRTAAESRWTDQRLDSGACHRCPIGHHDTTRRPLLCNSCGRERSEGNEPAAPRPLAALGLGARPHSHERVLSLG